MAFKKRTCTLTVSGTTASATLGLGAAYGRIIGFSALSVGTSTTQKLTITDADSLVCYADAAAADYDSARVNKIITVDNTATGATVWTGQDNTGAAAAAGEPAGHVVARSPVTVSVAESEGGNEVITFALYVEV